MSTIAHDEPAQPADDWRPSAPPPIPAWWPAGWCETWFWQAARVFPFADAYRDLDAKGIDITPYLRQAVRPHLDYLLRLESYGLDQTAFLWSVMPAKLRAVLSDLSRSGYSMKPYVREYYGLPAPPTLAEQWAPHVSWLKDQFAERMFTCLEIQAAANQQPDWTAPPGIWDAESPGFTRDLGKAYSSAAKLDGGGVGIQAGSLRHGIGTWTVAPA